MRRYDTAGDSAQGRRVQLVQVHVRLCGIEADFNIYCHVIVSYHIINYSTVT